MNKQCGFHSCMRAGIGEFILIEAITMTFELWLTLYSYHPGRGYPKNYTASAGNA